jgi:HEAT repeats/Putative zinc-finger
MNERNDDNASNANMGNQNAIDSSPAIQACADWEDLIVLAAAGEELDSAEQARLNTHLSGCASCSAALERENNLLRVLAEHATEPSGALLASCRATLEDALDREEERGWLSRMFGPILPASWLAPRPAWSAAVLLAFGFAVGILAPRAVVQIAARHGYAGRSAGVAAMPSPAAPSTGNAQTADNEGSTSDTAFESSNSAKAPAFSPGPLDLHYADVAGINVSPSGGGSAPPEVVLHFNAQQPSTVRGTVNDDDVKSVLLDVIRHSNRLDPDICMNALDVLHSCNNDPEVRAALCRVVREDTNPSVRLKALQALDGSDPEDIVRNTLVDALAGDQNSDVRIQAVDELRDWAASGQVGPDKRMLSVLRSRVQSDPDDYVRAQSAATIREIAAKQ